MKFSLRARIATEFIGTAFLVAAVVGSRITGERLAAGSDAILSLVAVKHATAGEVCRR